MIAAMAINFKGKPRNRGAMMMSECVSVRNEFTHKEKNRTATARICIQRTAFS